MTGFYRSTAILACVALVGLAGCGKRQLGLPGNNTNSGTKTVIVKRETPPERVIDENPWGKPQRFEYITRDAVERGGGRRTFGGEDETESWVDPSLTRVVQVGPATRRAGRIDQAVEQLQTELSESMKLRPALMVWVFDTTNSARILREEAGRGLVDIVEKYNKDTSGEKAMYAVMSFGADVKLDMMEPSNDPKVIEKAIEELGDDDGGVEVPFAALEKAAETFGKYRTEMNRQLMFVLVCDEAGDDQKVDVVASSLQSLAAPVYVLGVPAPFGKRGSLVNDNAERASPQDPTGVRTGPESCDKEMVEVEFMFSGFGKRREEATDSGFGPWALTRLCFATGGTYYTIPEEATRTPLDPTRLAEYAPEYISAAEYKDAVQSNPAKAALVAAAKLPKVPAPSLPEQLFPKNNESRMKNMLTEAQKAAARVEPSVNAVYDALKAGEKERDKLESKRWQASFDLAMGRVLAAKVRIEGYNAMLANLKLGKRSQNPNSTGWMLRQSDTIEVSSQLAKMQKDSQMYLQRVVDQHPGTPWAALAERELKTKMGWEWSEE